MADVVTLWGETGTPASITIPCMVAKATYDAGSPSDFYATNGAALAAGSSKTVTSPAVPYILTDTGAFAGLTLTGMYIYISAGASGVGYYEISANDDNTVTFSGTALDAIAAASIGTTDHAYTIGGLGQIDDPDVDDKFQLLLDLMGSAVTSVNNLDILLNQSFTIDTTIDIDNISGSLTTRHRVIPTNASFVEDSTQVTITASALFTGTSIFAIADTSDYVVWLNLNLNANNEVNYCVLATSHASLYHTFVNCRFQKADVDGINSRSSTFYLISCEIDNNTTNGYKSNGANAGAVNLKLCSVHDNGVGIYQTDSATIEDCLIYNNTTGINVVNYVVFSQYINNVYHSNTDADMDIQSHAGNIGINVINCSFYGATRAFDLTAQSDYMKVFNLITNCHFQVDTDTYLTGVAAVDMTYLGAFNSIYGDPKFGDPTTPAWDFIPDSDSPLIDAGVGGIGDTIGALCATAGGGGGVTGVSKSRIFGGM